MFVLADFSVEVTPPPPESAVCLCTLLQSRKLREACPGGRQVLLCPLPCQTVRANRSITVRVYAPGAQVGRGEPLVSVCDDPAAAAARGRPEGHGGAPAGPQAITVGVYASGSRHGHVEGYGRIDPEGVCTVHFSGAEIHPKHLVFCYLGFLPGFLLVFCFLPNPMHSRF